MTTLTLRDQITSFVRFATSTAENYTNALSQGVNGLRKKICSDEFIETARERSFSYYEGAKNFAQSFALSAATKTTNLVHEVTALVQSSEGIDTVLRFTHEGVTFADLARHSEAVSRPILTYFGAAIGIVNLGRFISAISDLVNGKALGEYAEKKYLDVAITVSLLFARTYSTACWCVQHNLVSKAFLLRPLQMLSNTKVAQVLAQNRAFQYAGPVVQRVPVIGLLYLTAFTALAIKNKNEAQEKVQKGENITYNVLEGISMSSYVALIALGLTPFGTPLVSAALGTIAAGTGIAAFFAGRAASQTKTAA